MHAWDPTTYLSYADERTRPFVELLARVPDPHGRAVASVVDLGCGPGHLTALLARRWPGATVHGVDASAEMIASARERAGSPGAGVTGESYEVADLRDWLAEAAHPGRGAGERPDVLVSNATLQWLPDPLVLLPAMVGRVAPGGFLAIGVPANFDEPSHVLRRELAAEAPYAAHTAGVASPWSPGAMAYLEALADLGCEVDAWETTYLHVLEGEDAVFDWISGTGARPTLQALPDGLREEFAEELRRRLRAAYPPRDGRVVLPFRRAFAVARVPA